MSEVGDLLRDALTRGAQQLASVSEEASARRPEGGGWSPREVLGHLVDSACVNHRRFVDGQAGDELVFPGYPQDDWVARQGYGDAPWAELTELWRRLNEHVARIMDHCSDDDRLRPRARHNLHQIAWQQQPAAKPVTLEFFMRDYVGHLEHHLQQIRKLTGD